MTGHVADLRRHYRLFEAHFDEVRGQWEERFERRFGFWRGFVDKQVLRYLDCGLFENGFARIRCPDCAEEYLLAFSCKTRELCPSCAAKRSVATAALLADEVLEQVGHAQWVFVMPKMLRPYFLHHRELLGGLAHAAWETVLELMCAAAGEEGMRPGMVAVVQTAGDLANWHPHVHAIVSRAGWTRDWDEADRPPGPLNHEVCGPGAWLQLCSPRTKLRAWHPLHRRRPGLPCGSYRGPQRPRPQAKLVTADQADLRGRSAGVPVVRFRDEGHRVHRRACSCRRDPEASRKSGDAVSPWPAGRGNPPRRFLSSIRLRPSVQGVFMEGRLDAEPGFEACCPGTCSPDRRFLPYRRPLRACEPILGRE